MLDINIFRAVIHTPDLYSYPYPRTIPTDFSHIFIYILYIHFQKNLSLAKINLYYYLQKNRPFYTSGTDGFYKVVLG